MLLKIVFRIHSFSFSPLSLSPPPLLWVFPQLDLEKLALGIFSRRIGHDQVLATGDRVEIYRPLVISPGEARRRRAQLKSSC